jgi:hypothetical protein
MNHGRKRLVQFTRLPGCERIEELKNVTALKARYRPIPATVCANMDVAERWIAGIPTTLFGAK